MFNTCTALLEESEVRPAPAGILTHQCLLKKEISYSIRFINSKVSSACTDPK